MKNYLFYFAFALLIAGCKASNSPKIRDIVDQSLTRAVEQSTAMYAVLDTIPNMLPRSINEDGSLIVSDSYFWTSGFYPGILWYLYEYSKDSKIKEMATRMSDRVEIQKNNKDNHDVGFMINCSFGNKLRLTGDTSCKNIIATTAQSLSTRYRASVGCTRSWSHPGTLHWQFPVIIDNMMNLELLLKATKLTGDKSFYDIAVNHANKTMQNHFRLDFSSYHVVDYDTISGKAIQKCTWQGYSDESAWSRGQAWGLYGFTMMYRETKDIKYLEHAKNIANFLINSPNMPEDKIPYWDFNDPKIPNTYKDASAAAIMASAFIELSTFVSGDLAKDYLGIAEQQIITLSSDKYLAKKGENGNFILKHSVGFLPQNNEVDVPLSYADYYFIEALIRYKSLKL